MIGTALYLRNTAIMATLLVATGFDLKERRIPNATVMTMFVCGLLSIIYILAVEGGFRDSAEDTLLEQGLGFIVATLICVISRYVAKEGLGAGDIKMLAALGFTLGLTLFLRMMIFTSVTALVFTIVMLLMRRLDKKSTLPFAPYITLGVCMTFLSDFISR